VDARRDPNVEVRFDEVVRTLGIEIAPVTEGIALRARRAYVQFGRGNHPARLNYGDCFAYALAKVEREPLLFKGNDFAQTDIEPALKP
jgi:ribonuclease VapC